MEYMEIAAGIAVVLFAFFILRAKLKNTPDKSSDQKSIFYHENSEVIEILKKGEKIKTIKKYKELYRTGLKEAKDAIEEMEKKI